MPITILPATQPDIPTLVHIELEAFKSHPRIPMLWPNGYTPDLYAFYESKKLSSLHDPNTQLLKAVDSANPDIILGAAEVTYALDPAVNAAQPAPDPNGVPPSNWPEGGNWEMRRYFSVNTHKLVQESFIDRGEGYILIDILVTHPTHQNTGIGSRFLTYIIEESQRCNVHVGLESTPAGLAMYKKLGFEEQAVVKADMKQFGWEGEYDEDAAKRVWMVRRPV
ncbi:Putative GNAT domain, acyl-CoA N-acyltransferase [Septoria linicola]|uniref:GNAT domain, acyl-CoA N-acyltransferase n=1 Tax=Septoria linicola TaxID=215465 RepID=A0A9Q9EMK3_9PEZI|nr:putative GNAT domain, acyl-CoA N-acyltransferase [Septoria linicola]USW55622.1 Putative GNAT domain, acyl-CoA N-acyltransferase [Septoria linicola]